MILLEA